MVQGIKDNKVQIIGAGLAGCEAAIVLARNDIDVELVEMRPEKNTPAHKTALPAELVCSNSLKSAELPSAQALLKTELSLMESPLMACAKKTAVPAGSALAVDRVMFSELVQKELSSHPRIKFTIREAENPQSGSPCLIAAGPLVSDSLAKWLMETFSAQSLSFYDAIAPIVSADSVDMDIAFHASRWKPESTDYLNCPFTEEEYTRFYDELIKADLANAREFEKSSYFEACLPLEVIAGRGKLSLAFGPLKPVGFTDPRTGKRPYAVCQLRRERIDGTGFGMVAFQTRLKIPDQQKVFRLIPGLEHAEFLRYGSCHRNSFMDSPSLLSPDLSFKAMPEVFLAGQLCGNEGYVESIATGHLAALSVLSRIKNNKWLPPPINTACGALVHHVTMSEIRPFVPSSFNFGLLPVMEYGGGRKPGKKEKHELLCKRAIADFNAWLSG
jgi:methylenetetrahydrofolate--tRNA-(uracil-5-)-methyltransferase